MPVKFKILFYNVMIFLILFDIIYLIVWMFTIEMNPVKAIVVAGITAVLMPWARSTNSQSRNQVVIRSYGVDLYKKYLKSWINKNSIYNK